MKDDMKPPLVSVGMTTYNNPAFLRRSLERMTAQTYKNLEIIVSDDCSPEEETQKIVREFAHHDSRIRFYRQEKNLTAVKNYRFVFEQATGEYFVWADDDDEWDESFLEKGITFLQSNPEYDAWCCTEWNIDSFGRVFRRLPGFSRFTSTQDKRKDLIKYLREPESMQKAALFHSIFRREAIRKVFESFRLNNSWGNDLCFILAFLVRFNLFATDEVLFYKRIVRDDDNEEVVHPILDTDYEKSTFLIEKSIRFIYEHYKAVRGTPYTYLVLRVMLSRVPIAFRNKWIASKGLIGLLKGAGRRVLRKFGYTCVSPPH